MGLKKVKTFADFTRLPEKEMQKVMKRVIARANKMQNDLIKKIDEKEKKEKFTA